jgi:hypothetical protein
MGLLKNLFGVRETAPAPQAVVNAAIAAPQPQPQPAPPPHVRSPAAPRIRGAAAPLVRAPGPPLARAPAPPPVKRAAPPPEFVEHKERRYYEIMETYQNRERALNELVTWDKDEEARLRALRVEAYQRRNNTEYKPHDVFSLWPYRPVDPELVIKRVMLKSGAPKILPEYSQILHVHVVSDRVMRAISDLDGNGRQAFYALDIEQPDGGTPYRYHFMQFLEHTDCTIPKLGGFRKGVREDGTSYWVRTSTDDKVFLDADQVGNRHFFCDKRAKAGCFISGDLTARLGDFLPRGYYLADAGLMRKPS